MTSMFGSVASAAANATWRDSGWAVTHLQPHAGKTLRVAVVPPFATSPLATFGMRVTADGDWESVDHVGNAYDAAAMPVDATLRLTATVSAKLAQMPDKPGGALDLSGDPGFVSALRDLHDVLPIAIEDRMARIVGPIVAHAMMKAMRSLAQWPPSAAERLTLGTSAWIAEEQQMLVGRPAFERFSRDVEAVAARASLLVEPHSR